MSDDGSVAVRTGDDYAEVSEVEQKLAEKRDDVAKAERVLAVARNAVKEAEKAADAAPPGANVGQKGPARIKLKKAVRDEKAAFTSFIFYKHKLTEFKGLNNINEPEQPPPDSGAMGDDEWVSDGNFVGGRRVVDEKGRERWIGDELGGNPLTPGSMDRHPLFGGHTAEYAWTPGKGDKWEKRLEQMRRGRERRVLEPTPPELTRFPPISRDSFDTASEKYGDNKVVKEVRDTDGTLLRTRYEGYKCEHTDREGKFCEFPVVRKDGLDQKFCRRHGGLSPSVQGGGISKSKSPPPVRGRMGNRGTTPKPETRSPPPLTAMAGIKKRMQPIPIVVKRGAAQPIPVRRGALAAAGGGAGWPTKEKLALGGFPTRADLSEAKPKPAATDPLHSQRGVGYPYLNDEPVVKHPETNVPPHLVGGGAKRGAAQPASAAEKRGRKSGSRGGKGDEGGGLTLAARATAAAHALLQSPAERLARLFNAIERSAKEKEETASGGGGGGRVFIF